MAKLQLCPAAQVDAAGLVDKREAWRLDWASLATLQEARGALHAAHAAAWAAAEAVRDLSQVRLPTPSASWSLRCMQHGSEKREADTSLAITQDRFHDLTATAPGKSALLTRLHHEFHSESSSPESRLVALTAASTALEARVAAVHRLQIGANSESPSSGTMLLSDLLGAPELAAALLELVGDVKVGFLALLRTLFLPTGINLRNLVWHGFLCPDELPREYGSLMLMILLVLPAVSTAVKSDVSGMTSVGGWKLDSMDGRMPAAYDAAATAILAHEPEDQLNGWLKTAPLVGSGRGDLAAWALTRLRQGQPLLFMLAVLPLLEHGLRRWFAMVNSGCEDYALAQEAKYYSTLDGFGQRSRHQLLLALGVHQNTTTTSNTRGNQLLPVLGQGVYSLLADLFMHLAGPSIRGKIAHGNVNVSQLYESTQHSKMPRVVSMVLVLFVALCERKCERTSHVSDRCNGLGALGAGALVSKHKSLFHPHALLTVGLQDAAEALLRLQAVSDNRDWEFHSASASNAKSRDSHDGGMVMTIVQMDTHEVIASLHEHHSNKLPLIDTRTAGDSALARALKHFSAASNVLWGWLKESAGQLVGKSSPHRKLDEPTSVAQQDCDGGIESAHTAIRATTSRFYVLSGVSVWVLPMGWAGIVAGTAGQSLGSWLVQPVGTVNIEARQVANIKDLLPRKWDHGSAPVPTETNTSEYVPRAQLFSELLHKRQSSANRISQLAAVPVVDVCAVVAAEPNRKEPPHPLFCTMVRCLLAVLEVVTQTSRQWHTKLAMLESAVCCRTASTAQRRLYATMLVCSEYAVAALALVAGCADAHIRQCISSRDANEVARADHRVVFMKRLLNAATAFGKCVADDTGDRRPFEEVFEQLAVFFDSAACKRAWVQQ
eukprot:SAG31_NODE_1727_length_7429_cov_4.342701_5_plen_890_part_00